METFIAYVIAGIIVFYFGLILRSELRERKNRR